MAGFNDPQEPGQDQDTEDQGASSQEQQAPEAPAQPAAPAPAAPSVGGGLTPFQQEMADHWHGKGMSLAGIAGILGGTHYESELNGGYDAQNPNSGASGAYQYLGDRADKEAAFAQAHGMDPWDHAAQNEYATSEIMPGGPEWDSTGKYIWQAQDPALAGKLWISNWERPGPAGTAIEAPAAARKAQELYPLLQARYASGAPGTQIASAGASDATPDIAIGDSIAAGIAHHAGFKQSLNPYNNNSAADMSVAAADSRTTGQTLQYIQAHAQELANQNVILSSGMSNDLNGVQGPVAFGKALQNVKDQIDALKAAGANPVLLGVGSGVKNYQQANDMLAKLAQENGVPFSGELAATQGGRVHPSDYGAVLAQAKFNPAQGTAEATPGSTPQDRSARISDAAALRQMLGQSNGQGRWDNTRLPPGIQAPVPLGSRALEAKALRDAIANNKASPNSGDPRAQPQSVGATLGTAFGDLLRGAGAGFLDKLGMPADFANFVNHYYAQHPKDAVQLGLGPEAGTAAYFMNSDPTASIPEEAPNAQAPRIPLGSEDLRAAAKYAGVNLDQVGKGGGNDLIYDTGNFIGAGFAPTQFARQAVNMTARTLLGHVLLHNVVMPGLAAGGMDLGRELTDKAVDNGYITPGVAQAIGIGSRAALGVGGLALMGRAAMAGQGLRAQMQDALQPGRVLDEVLGDKVYTGNGTGTPADARARLLGDFTGPPQALPPGYEAPTFTRTSNIPLQQLAHNVMGRTLELHGMDERNLEAMEAMRPEGDANSAIEAIQNAQQTRDEMLTQAVANVETQAHQNVALRAAQLERGGATGLPLGWGGAGQLPQYALGQEMVDQLHAVKDLAFAHADDMWDVAREGGHLEAAAPASMMMRNIQGVIGDDIRRSQGANLPVGLLRDLYTDGGNPMEMFDARGNRIPSVQPTPLFQDSNTTIGDLQNFSSRVGADIRAEQRAITGPAGVGSPQRLARLVQIQQHVADAIRQGAENAEPGNPGTVYAVQNAQDATRQAYGNFVTDGLSHVLNNPDGPRNAPQAIAAFLGNSNKAIKARDFFNRMLGSQMGVNALAQAGTDPKTIQQNFYNTWADWMRQSYMRAHTELGGPAAGQRWLQNQQGVFDAMRGTPQFDQLHAELQGHAQAEGALPQVLRANQDWASRNRLDLENNAQALFLNGKGPQRLDTLLQAPGDLQGQLMQGLIRDTLGDPTGSAFRGLQGLMFDRLMQGMKVNSNPLRPGSYYYSFNKGQDLLDAAKPALDVMGQHDPEFTRRVQAFVNAGKSEDVLKQPPGINLPEMAQARAMGGQGIGTDLATRLFQMAFTRAVSPIIEGGGMANSMQAAGQASAFARGLAQRFSAMLPSNVKAATAALDTAENSRRAIKDAVMDPNPEKLRALLAPRQGAYGKKWSSGLEPWLRASGVMLPQGIEQEQEQGRQPPGASAGGISIQMAPNQPPGQRPPGQ